MAGLSANSEKLVTEFFREYLGEPDFVLPRVVFATGATAGMTVRLLGVRGITIGRFVVVAPGLPGLDASGAKLPRDLVVHEIAHVIQYRSNGFFRFLYVYFRDYLGNLKKEGGARRKARHAAYLAIPFEIEARQTAREFERWLDERNRLS
jgi:hypothetical protein